MMICRQQDPLFYVHFLSDGPKLFRAYPEFFFERFMKVGIIVKSAFHARLHDRSAFLDHVPRYSKPFFNDKLNEAQTGILFELMGQIGFAYKTYFRKPIERQVFRQVFVDIRDNLVDLFIFCDILRDCIRCGEIRPVQETINSFR